MSARHGDIPVRADAEAPKKPSATFEAEQFSSRCDDGGSAGGALSSLRRRVHDEDVEVGVPPLVAGPRHHPTQLRLAR
jgi:hypothetical protein